ncbi:beta-lactamase class A [Halopseudomonas xinjiangensis]|uniref:beta-lactamase n=1 Tax=Halopseudomonas xinjiangensis TaxID=487184 RepID=A0A1H1RGA9_9GAMM|nr:serine hydrolase [Halopseudomonas xinjiangensis]SDS33939.1 beta-lactamase class A [Halopseudomonas xinjiangensis]
MRRALLTTTLTLLPCIALAATDWQKSLQDEITRIDNYFPGEVGLYVQRLGDGASLSWHANESWHLGSLMSVPIAVEVFDRIDKRELSLSDTVELEEARIVDGPGETSQHQPGTSLSIGYLLEQMLGTGDQTAADVLIGVVGLDAVNQRAQQLLPPGSDYEQLGPITRPLEMHRNVFGIMHRGAFDLTATDFLEIRKAGDADAQVEAFQQRLGIGEQDLKVPDLTSAYALYYATPINSGQLDSFAGVLATVQSGQALSPESTEALLTMMRLGHGRLGSSLPDSASYAHLRSDLPRRVCDAGVISTGMLGGDTEQDGVIVAACTRGAASAEEAGQALSEIGKAVAQSGILRTAE